MKTAYVIGNGPSLNKIDIKKLKGKDTISFNRAFIAYEDWGFDPTYYMVVDPIVLENIKSDIKDLIFKSEIRNFFLPHYSKEYFGENEKIQYIKLTKRRLTKRYFWGKRFNKLSTIANVGASSIPILKILGYKQIVILGTDCNYVEKDIKNVEIEHNADNPSRRIVYKASGDNDPNHFRKDYFGTGTEYSKPQQGNHYRGWEYIANENKKHKLKILLCSPGSTLVNLFPETDFEKIINI